MLGEEKIQIVFANADDSPENWWVEDLNFVKNSVSSWGFKRRQING